MSEQTDRKRLDELKTERALFGLSEQDFAELMQLSNRLPNEDLDDLDRVAAAVEQVLSDGTSEEMPGHLRQTLLAKGGAVVRERRHAAASDSPYESVAMSRQQQSEGRAAKLFGLIPWFVAAACMMFALFVWYDGRTSDRGPGQLRSELLSQANDIVQVDWSPGTTPIEGAGGDVVWSPELQRGYMRFVDLPVNQPTKEQYQLWIFSKNQDEATPIDGGVFNIDAEGEVIVPINAKLQADDVYLFAVTIEKPGGVVVSTRERLPLLAKVN